MNILLFFVMSLLFINHQSNANTPVSWSGSAPGGFSAEITLSDTEPSLADILTVHLTLTYPPTHHPRIEALIPQLLSYDGFNEPPFHLFSKVKKSSSKPSNEQPKGLLSQQLLISLSSQIPGSQFLTFHTITFEPNQSNTSKAVEIISGVFQLNITTPPLDFQPQSLMAPLLSLSKDLPISLSFQNRRKFIDNHQTLSQEFDESKAFIKAKSLPWNLILALIAALLFYLLLKMPVKMSETKESNALTQSEFRTTALKKIDLLSKQPLAKQENCYSQIIQLDHIVRNFIEEYHHINAPTLTTPEFLKIASSTPSLNTTARQNLSTFLAHTDRVKFAKYLPTGNEFSSTLQAAKDFIENS